MLLEHCYGSNSTSLVPWSSFTMASTVAQPPGQTIVNKLKTASPRKEYDVYPVHMLDDIKQTKKMIMAWTFRFDAPLDAEMLRSSLARLLDVGDWRKLAGRLHFTVNIEIPSWKCMLMLRCN